MLRPRCAARETSAPLRKPLLITNRTVNRGKINLDQSAVRSPGTNPYGQTPQELLNPATSRKRVSGKIYATRRTPQISTFQRPSNPAGDSNLRHSHLVQMTRCASDIDGRLRIAAGRTLLEVAASRRHAALVMIGADRDRAVTGVIHGASAGDGHNVRRVEWVDVGSERPLGEGENATRWPGKRDPMCLASGSLRECDDVTGEMEVGQVRTSRSRVPAQGCQ